MANDFEAEDAKNAEELGEAATEVNNKAVEQGYAEEGLTEQQQLALDGVEDFREDADKLQESDDEDDMKAKRQQV